VSFIVIACGGTGGHLTPGIALAERLLERGHECLLLASQKKIDSRLLEKYPRLQYQFAPGSGLVWTPKGVFNFALSQARALRFASRLFRVRRPDVFVSFGGFLTLGPALASRRAGVPVVLHEANRVPGKAVRQLGKIATRVWLPPGVELAFKPGVLRHAGFPVRREIVPLPKAAARATLGFPETGKLLLVFGGSQGAAPLNDWVRRNAEKFTAAGVHVLCVTGPGKVSGEPVTQAETGSANANGSAAGIRFIPFCDKMPEVLSAADLVVSRSGAGSIAEFTACGLPSVLVPFPFAADNHQEANARFLESLDGGRVVAQSELENETANILALLGDDDALARMAAALRSAQDRFAWDAMLEDIEQLGERK
jgi:UDP-N-acetylglucosamine--N-acetylmuramyl-(pentapeptide) pyrophosphoryl-undecaprenol N-acetylglucosamine transferase